MKNAGIQRFCFLLCALMLMSALSGCRGRDSAEIEQLSLNVCVCAPLDSLDPALNTDPAAESIFYAVYENLLRAYTDEEGCTKTEPGMAREYRVVENYDGTVDYYFTLRSSARWSDGTRVKARDFVYAWRRLADPSADLPNHELLSMVKGYDAVRETGDLTQLSVKADSDTVFHVILSEPCPYFLSEICTAVATMPLRGEIVSKDAGWASGSDVLCNGPYRVGVWAKAAHIQLQSNSAYYESRAVKSNILRFHFARDAAEALRFYAEGRVDYAASPPVGTENAQALPLRTVCCVLYNHMSESFSNRHVRSAFDLVLNRTDLAPPETGFSPATGLVPRGVPESEEAAHSFRETGGELIGVSAEDYPRRRAEAEIELRIAGYDEGDGFPETTCLYVRGESDTTASLLTKVWSEALKLPVSAEGLSREDFDLRIESGEYGLAIDTLRYSGGDAMEYLEAFAGTDGNNQLHYVNKPYDLLIGVARTTQNSAARAACLHDAEKLLLEDAALSPLYFGAKTFLLRENLEGVRHDPRGNAIFTTAVLAE